MPAPERPATEALIRWKDPRHVNPIALHDANPWGSGTIQLQECGHLADCVDWNYDGLCNPFWRLYYNGKKGASVTLGGQRIPLLPTEVVVIPENIAFDSRGAAGVPHLWIHFSPPLALGRGEGLLRTSLDEGLSASLAELRGLLLEHTVFNESEKRQLFHRCMSVLHGWFAKARLDTLPPLPSPLCLLLEHIERSLGGDLTNPVLARQAGMSVEGLIRWFKHWMGTTPARHVAGRRIREACRLLALSEASIEEIAERTGFANRHHFSRVFLHYTHQGPAHFRREQRQG